jgi:hypothetical protein
MTGAVVLEKCEMGRCGRGGAEDLYGADLLVY